MSCYLWKFFLEDDVDSFRRLLAEASYVNWPTDKRGNNQTTGAGNQASSLGSPGPTSIFSPSARTTVRNRKSSGWSPASFGTKGESPWASLTVTRADINLKDRNGLTILLHAASSTSSTAIGFATALLEHPLIDLYTQDLENGWTVLHRALYFGNITIARLVMGRDMRDVLGHNKIGTSLGAGGLIRIKDREGNSPFDLLNATVASRLLIRQSDDDLEIVEEDDGLDASDDDDEWDDDGHAYRAKGTIPHVNINGDEVFTFGSNKNLTLGFNDEDDRQFPERITLTRPDHLLHRFYYEHLQAKAKQEAGHHGAEPSGSSLPSQRLTSQLPAVIRNRPIIIQDVVLSKLHTAITTTDPESNLYMCGFGPGGRLGTGDETTRFGFVCIEGGGLAGKRVVGVALGQNHSLAITGEGEIFTWGSNSCGQLGYTLPKPSIKDDEPVQTSPRQLFGLLKRERIAGTAASRIHSVVYTSSSLYTFGKNEGQLGLVDADARSLDLQTTPRKVAASLFSSPIKMVSAIDRATTCLLENHDVWVFANYGYAKMSFPLDGFTNFFLKASMFTTRYDPTPNHIAKITSGGDTICAMSRTGDVYTVNVGQRLEPSLAAASTTNPTKIRNALSAPQRIWSLRKGHMAVRDVDVGHDGSVIICTESGSVWRRVKRAKIKDAESAGGVEYRARDYKFSRVPGLTRIKAVRSNVFGAYAAVRQDCDVTRTQIVESRQGLWDDLAPLLSFRDLEFEEKEDDGEDEKLRFWTPSLPKDHVEHIKRAVLLSDNLEEELSTLFAQKRAAGELSMDVDVCTTLSDVHIPMHGFVLASRSGLLRKVLIESRRSGRSSLADVLIVESTDDGKTRIEFQGLDFVTILNLVHYACKDTLIDVWHHARYFPKSALRFRQVRTELMRIASRLELKALESAVRLMNDPEPCLDLDMSRALSDPTFFDDADVVVELAGSEVKVHGDLMCRRCPFFEGLFNGRAGGLWLSSRRELSDEHSGPVRVDLKHVEPAVFAHILRYLYADVGEELFDEVVSGDLDEFLDLVIETLSVANELMLDRLSQVCQKILGRFVTTRNACQLLNAVAPCSVTAFKDACLEYMCLNLEGMLENHLLDELDEDLLLELDGVVRENQLAFLPFVRSGRAETLLAERHPELTEAKDRERQAKIDSVAIRARSGEDTLAPPKNRRKSSKQGGTEGSPRLKGKASAADLMFNMDDDEGLGPPSLGVELKTPPATSRRTSMGGPSIPPLEALPQEEVWYGSNGKVIESPSFEVEATSPTPNGRSTKPSLEIRPRQQRAPGSESSAQPWGTAPVVSSSKLDLKEIIAQASSSRTSHLSASISNHQIRAKAKDKPATSTQSPGLGKLSQRERKKQQQQQQANQINSPPFQPVSAKNEPGKPRSPWQSQSPAPRVSLKEVLSSEERQHPAAGSLTQTSSIPAMSLNNDLSARSDNRSLPTRGPPQRQSPVLAPQTKAPHHSPGFGPRSSLPEPSLQLSMSEIISQQRTEQEILRQAVAKRSLQEIQQEQEFLEWWDSETKKTNMAAEPGVETAARKKGGEGSSRSGRGGRGRGRGGGGGSGGKNRGGSVSSSAPSPGRTKTGEASVSRAETKAASTGRGRGGGVGRGRQPHASRGGA